MEKKRGDILKWLSVRETSELLEITERAVQKAAKKQKYDSQYVQDGNRGGIEGGQKLQIALESLPEEAQKKYWDRLDAARNAEYFEFMARTTENQRNTADRRAWIVEDFTRSKLSYQKYVTAYNAEHEEKEWLSKATLLRWCKAYDPENPESLVSWCGRYEREDRISPAAWAYFYDLYMTQQRRTVQLCYDLTKDNFPDVPSYHMFYRRVKQIPKPALIYYRKGKKAYEDECLPSMERNKDMPSNAIWFSDHHRCDVFVKTPDGKNVFRPWLTVFFDARSNKMISWIVRRADPNATVIKQCLRKGMEEFGVPDEVYFDNGKDYRSKDFSTEFPLSMVNQVGIGIIHATPYHGQAKTVERFFGTYTDRFSRSFATYTGKDAKERPECMRIPNSKIAKLAPSLEEYIAAVDSYMKEYNLTSSRGRNMDNKCPDEVYFQNLTLKRTISNRDALRLLCGNTEVRTVHKNGISILNNTFRNDKLLPLVGQQVSVTYDPENIDQIAVFDLKRKAICMASATIRTPFRNTSEEDYIRAANEKKKARQIVKEHAPSRNMEIHSIIARNQMFERQFEQPKGTQVVEQATPQVMQSNDLIQNTATKEDDNDYITELFLAEYMNQKKA